MSGVRYRLQRREAVAMSNILGNHSMPVYTHRWKDICASDDKSALEALMPNGSAEHRIEDTRAQEAGEGGG